ncbi:NADPH:quinone oxidoreductase family protein [Peribacillus castrilensis]|jgi:putative YhdH/YhfP family quinone oxidoreductase|uniref:Oxidoreductase n=3 Tax=Peribacillus TaxID=2675229 RepID=A0AAN2TR27_9BACI|nr:MULTISPECIES: acryloyl-CoA reductase [Bacillaceae]MCP1096534.1 acryloyl-CoA reductase [Bacillaceae bacterium OS4b]MEC0272068.1 acryloyl-CoA reductase [Peribacillus castrilensis]MBD8590226.1 acryloyl-CoA reductase [Peribacillus simplex]MCF7624899.1 acryloyl-CoA reductase [Peribacillus frigoritolerans]MCT1390901.1 acryloyl-CoA reductase [Peribacillus frigoritolerans]
MIQQFDALVVNKQDDQFTVNIQQLSLDDLPQGEVLIRVHYSGVNYKDSLAAIPNGNIVSSYPIVPGIDMAGVVVSSEDSRFKEGDEVIATSYGIGVSQSGGYSQFARVPAEWIVPLPDGLTMKEAMIIGTAGFTAALSVLRLEENNLTPEQGSVLVTGATGGVGSFAVSILSKLGYSVEASTGKESEHGYLKAIGASTIVSREDVYDGKLRALGKQKWSGAVDPVGGEPLASVLSQIKYGGAVAVSGLTAGTSLPATVFPFILRGVNLLGIDSVNCPMDTRLKVWHRLATDFKLEDLEQLVQQEITLKELPDVLPTLLKGEARGRTIVKL